MFHDDFGNVYSWSRKWGTVAFTAAYGLINANSFVSLPAVVTSEEGVRPEMIIVGVEGEEEERIERYLCVCRKVVESRIRAVYWGSPFDEWFPLPTPSDGFELVQVRTVRAASLFNLMLVGVVWGQKVEADEPGYYLASLEILADGDPGTPEEDPEWKIHGRLPFVDVPYTEVPGPDGSSFQIGLFGNDDMVTEMMSVPGQPPVTTQLPACPDYSLYEYSFNSTL